MKMGILDKEHNLDEKLEPPLPHWRWEGKFCFLKPTLCTIKNMAKGFMYRRRV
jgi:hypothetical protein